MNGDESEANPQNWSLSRLSKLLQQKSFSESSILYINWIHYGERASGHFIKQAISILWKSVAHHRSSVMMAYELASNCRRMSNSLTEPFMVIISMEEQHIITCIETFYSRQLYTTFQAFYPANDTNYGVTISVSRGYISCKDANTETFETSSGIWQDYLMFSYSKTIRS